MPHAIAQVPSRDVRRILDVRYSAGRRIVDDRCTAQPQKRPNHFRLREQCGQTSRPGIAQDADEDRLDLIVQRVRSCNRPTEFGGGLADLFRGRRETAQALAAYNAGESRVARWLKKTGSGDPELFTERIPFVETRDYVRSVVRNRAFYKTLYDW